MESIAEMGAGGPPGEIVRPGVQFLGHMVMATVILVVLGLAALALAKFAGWLEENKAPEFIVLGFQGLEFFVFAVDAILFVFYVAGEAYKFGRSRW